MADVNTTKNEALLVLNDLEYKFPSHLSIQVRRHRTQSFFQRNTYPPRDTMVIDSQTGSAFVSGCDSYLSFNFKPVGAGGNWGSGSVLNLFKTIRVKTRGGQEINRIENFNVLMAKHPKWTNDNDWMHSEGGSLGFADYVNVVGTVFDAKNVNMLHSFYASNSYAVAIPLKYIAPVFAQDKLLPPQLMEGLRIEIELESSENACVGASITSYDISQPRILFDCTTIGDSFARRVGEMAATQGLNIMYTNFYSNQVSGSSAGQQNFNYDVKKAASLAMRLWTVSRDVASLQAAAKDSLGSLPFDYSSMSCHIGSDYFSNTPIRIDGYVATTVEGGLDNTNTRLLPEVYYHILTAVRENRMIKSYPSVSIENTSTNANGRLDAIMCFSFNKSTVDNYAGYAINNSRALVVDLEVSTAVNTAGITRRVDNWLEHLRNVRIFSNQAVISD